MPDCRKCGVYFPLKQVIEGKPRILKSRKYCLVCSPFGQHNTRKLDESRPELIYVCSICGDRYNAGHRHYKNYCGSCRSVRRRQTLKRMAIEHMGGRCQLCGYDRCVQALHFHHLEPHEKEFTFANYSRSWERLRVEIEKCVLLCGNCHTEVHAGITVLAPSSQI